MCDTLCGGLGGLDVQAFLSENARLEPATAALVILCCNHAIHPRCLHLPSVPRLQMHRTSRLLIASTGVDSEWAHAKAATEANPAVAYLNADLWYRWCLLPEGHEFLYQTPALCSNASYSQANVPVTIVLSSKVRNCTLAVEEIFVVAFFVFRPLYGLRR